MSLADIRARVEALRGVTLTVGPGLAELIADRAELLVLVDDLTAALIECANAPLGNRRDIDYVA